MKRLTTLFFTGLIVFSLAAGNEVGAANIQPAPDETLLPAYISGFSLVANGAGSQLALIEIYNSSNRVVNLDGWRVELASETESCEVQLSGYLLAKSFGLLAVDNSINQSQIMAIGEPGCGLESSAAGSIGVVSPSGKSEFTDDITFGDFVRVNTTSTYRGGTFKHNFTSVDKATNRTPKGFYFGGWHFPVESTPIRIVEILPRSRNCSPSENVMGCQDYIKLHNPTTETWQLEGLRLRMGYAGQSETTSNAINLSGSIAEGGYLTFMTKADGSSLSITDGGGWVWLEDAQGIGGPLKNAKGESSIVEYPSASSVGKVGWAWAYDMADGKWKWTTKLAASDQPSEFYIPASNEPGRGGGMTTGSDLKPCRSDQFRNPLTNRCKLIASTTSSKPKPCAPHQYRNPETGRCKAVSSASSSLVPCKAGQYRNPETNRCKSSTAAAGSLVACKPGQYRNPETNRCKAVASMASSLKPCAEGQERNPETNRCRKIKNATLASASHPVEPYGDSGKQVGGWLAFAAVGSAAAGYGVWEWRREISGAVGRLKSLVGK